MHIKAKLYPYPVLANFNNDYQTSRFNIEITMWLSEGELVVHLNPILDNKQIQDLINIGKASMIVHVECPLTSYRKVVKVSNESTTIRISADKIEGPISFCPFVVVEQDIFGYTNDDLNPDYENARFDLEKGNVLAIGQEAFARVEKEDDELANVPSIFAVTEIKDETREDIVIDNTGNKINIQLPTKSFFEFKLAMNNPSATTIIHSMIIIPALMKCFDDIKSKPEEFYIFEDRRWFRALKKALRKIGFELTEENLTNLDGFVLAQKIMENTTCRAILEINNISFKGDANDD